MEVDDCVAVAGWYSQGGTEVVEAQFAVREEVV